MKQSNQSKFHGTKRAISLIFLALGASMFAPSCASNEELAQRLDRRTESYSKYQDRKKMRAEARDDRYDAWYDRVMH